MPVAGGMPKRLTYHTGNDEVVGWSRDGSKVVFRAARGDGAFPNVAVLYEVPVTGGLEKALPVDWGFWGNYSPDGKSLVFNRHPAVWSRQHYRGAYAADLWVANLTAGTYTPLLADAHYNRYWPMWGADNNIYFVADPLPNDNSVKPGSADVRKSANNIYRIAASGGGQPVQVTKHLDGNVFWPSMSADGKTIVYEDNFGIWKLDVASGKSSEIKLDITTDEKDNEHEIETVTDEVDTFDLSPSGRRAVISARGQILTIATERGDITRIAPDAMASRSDSPKWSPDGKYIAYVSDRSGRDEVWISDPEGNAPKKITELDNEKGALVWAPDSSRLFFTAADRKLYDYTVADAKTAVLSSSDRGRINSVAVSPDSKWVSFTKQDATLRSHVYIIPSGGGEERRLADDAIVYSETNAVWTADGRYIVFTSAEGFSNGIASQGGIQTTMELWVTPLRDQDRDPMNRDIDNEAQGLAAEAAARQAGGGRGGAGAQPVTVQIDWGGLARRARRLSVPATQIGGLTPAPDGHRVALTLSSGAAGGGRGAGAADPERRYFHHRRRDAAADARAASPATECRRRTRTRRRAGRRRWWLRRRQHGVRARRPHTLLPQRHRPLCRNASESDRACWRGGGVDWWTRRTRRRRPGRTRHGRDNPDGPAGDLFRQHRGRSQGAARPGLQRGLAHHEEPVLRRQDAWRRLERRVGNLRRAPRQHRR